MNTAAQVEIRNLPATKSRSTLAFPETTFLEIIALVGLFGEPCWTRTSDPLLKRQMLYRLS